MIITYLHPNMTLEHLGMIPVWIQASPPSMPFAQIVAAHYVGGWRPPTCELGMLDTSTGRYAYPGDPVMKHTAAIMRAEANEIIFAYDHAMFSVVSVTPEAAALFVKGQPVPDNLPWVMVRLD